MKQKIHPEDLWLLIGDRYNEIELRLHQSWISRLLDGPHTGSVRVDGIDYELDVSAPRIATKSN